MNFTDFIKKVEDTFMSNQPPKVRAVNRWRYGQTLMNVLWDVWPEKYNEIKDSDLDCFYTNQHVNLTIAKLEKEWKLKVKQENEGANTKIHNLVQKWIIYHPEKQSFVTGKPYDYTINPNLARVYNNYTDAILACHNHYDKEFGSGHYPIELRMYFNEHTLKKEENKECLK